MNIVILSRNPALYSTQSLIYAARKRGHFVRVIDHMKCDLVMEASNLSVNYEGERIRDVDAIIPRIGSSATSYGAAVIRQFELLGVYTATSTEALLRSRDKRSAMQYLAAQDIPIPKSVVTNDIFSVKKVVEDFNSMPLIVKLLDSTQGLGVILAETKASAESILEAFIKLKQKVILQEYIAESKGADVRVFVVDNKVVAKMVRQAQPGEFRSNLHRGASAIVANLSEEEERVALAATKELGLKVAGVDLLRSDRGPLILEVNASPGLEGIEGTTGIDIAGKIIEMIQRSAGGKS